ncbi:MAG: hypothetical protein K0R63_971 [Rickettsiales bacterium]|jgi:hypothetical protein|nr:hypothetical protein [Rickettsiales bacterium]
MSYEKRESRSRIDEKKSGWIPAIIYAAVTGVFCYWVMPIIFGFDNSSVPQNMDFLTQDDIHLCSDRMGYEEGTYRYRHCLKERIAYNSCQAKNTAREAHYERDAEKFCSDEARRRFAQPALEEQHVYDQWPGPRQLNVKAKPYVYRPTDIADLRGIFTELCAKEWVSQRDILPSVLPDCEHLLEFSKAE